MVKVYESNGLIDIEEYVNLMNLEEFFDSIDHIRAMLEEISEKWLFADLSLTPKNVANFGYRDNGDIVILDAGYVYPIDHRIMHCTECGGDLKWDTKFTNYICTKCKTKHDPIDIRDRMWRDEDDFEREVKAKEERKKRGLVTLNLGPAWESKRRGR
jgi:hypothetical protein